MDVYFICVVHRDHAGSAMTSKQIDTTLLWLAIVLAVVAILMGLP
jgi:hypothetical protein